MPRYSPQYYSPPRRGYGSPPRRGYGGGGGGGGGGRPRSPPRRGYGGERGGRHKEDQNHGSLLVRNIPLSCRAEELRVPFERFGVVRDVYLPKNYYTGEPRGFAFVQFVDSQDAAEAQYHMNGQIFAGREISVVLAAETRKRPEDMRRRTRVRGPSGYEDRRPGQYGRSRSRSRSRSPRYPSGSRSRHRSRSYSPAPKRRSDYSPSPPPRRDHPRSPRDHSPQGRDVNQARRSYSPGYDRGAEQNGARRSSPRRSPSPPYDDEGGRGRYRSPPAQSRSPSGSRSRSADMSPPPRY